jgi:hypothetical protein
MSVKTMRRDTFGCCNGKVAVLYTRNIIEGFELYRAVIPK